MSRFDPNASNGRLRKALARISHMKEWARVRNPDAHAAIQEAWDMRERLEQEIEELEDPEFRRAYRDCMLAKFLESAMAGRNFLTRFGV